MEEREKKNTLKLTFTGNREEDQAARFDNIGIHKVLHKVDI